MYLYSRGMFILLFTATLMAFLSSDALAWSLEKKSLSINTDFTFDGQVSKRSAKRFKRGDGSYNKEDSRQRIRIGTLKSDKPTARITYFVSDRNSFEYWSIKDSYDNVKSDAAKYNINLRNYEPGPNYKRDGILFERAYATVYAIDKYEFKCVYFQHRSSNNDVYIKGYVCLPGTGGDLYYSNESKLNVAFRKFLHSVSINDLRYNIKARSVDASPNPHIRNVPYMDTKPSVKYRILELEKLVNDGLITRDEYLIKRKKILDDL